MDRSRRRACGPGFRQVSARNTCAVQFDGPNRKLVAHDGSVDRRDREPEIATAVAEAQPLMVTATDSPGGNHRMRLRRASPGTSPLICIQRRACRHVHDSDGDQRHQLRSRWRSAPGGAGCSPRGRSAGRANRRRRRGPGPDAARPGHREPGADHGRRTRGRQGRPSTVERRFDRKACRRQRCAGRGRTPSSSRPA